MYSNTVFLENRGASIETSLECDEQSAVSRWLSTELLIEQFLGRDKGREQALFKFSGQRPEHLFSKYSLPEAMSLSTNSAGF